MYVYVMRHGKDQGRMRYLCTESVTNVTHLYILECLTINVYAYVSRRPCFVLYPYLWTPWQSNGEWRSHSFLTLAIDRFTPGGWSYRIPT